jgi:hypothetical protein
VSGSPLDGLVVRAAAVRRPGLGYIYAGDPKLEADDVPHAINFKYKDGDFTRGEANFDANAITVVTVPELGLVTTSGAGYYSANMASGMRLGNIFDVSSPPPPSPRLGGIRSVATIAGRAHAIGLRGMVYRLDTPTTWTRLDDGLPETFNGQTIHGYNDTEIYAAGRGGQLWQYNTHTWQQHPLPTTNTLTCIHCADNNTVYIGGHNGTLITGRNNTWTPITTTNTDTIWGITHFNNTTYIATQTQLFTLTDTTLTPVDFGPSPPKTCGQLSTSDNVLWSIGEHDIQQYDGTTWTRIV